MNSLRLENDAYLLASRNTRFVLPGVCGNRTGIFFQQIIGWVKLLTSNRDIISTPFALVGLTDWKLLLSGHFMSCLSVPQDKLYDHKQEAAQILEVTAHTQTSLDMKTKGQALWGPQSTRLHLFSCTMTWPSLTLHASRVHAAGLTMAKANAGQQRGRTGTHSPLHTV